MRGVYSVTILAKKSCSANNLCHSIEDYKNVIILAMQFPSANDM